MRPHKCLLIANMRSTSSHVLIKYIHFQGVLPPALSDLPPSSASPHQIRFYNHAKNTGILWYQWFSVSVPYLPLRHSSPCYKYIPYIRLASATVSQALYALITHIANKQSDLSISSSEPSNPSVRSSETLPPFETLSLYPQACHYCALPPTGLVSLSRLTYSSL